MKPHQTYRHEAFLYNGDDEFVEGMAPFVQEGVASGQPVMVALVLVSALWIWPAMGLPLFL